MPRTYHRQQGTRRYADYTEDVLQQCLQDVKTGIKSQRAASEHYTIPRSTIKNKLKGAFNKPTGRPPVFSTDEEKAFVQHITKLSEFGFPLTEFDLRYILKYYVEKHGRQVQQFRGNMPGYEWVKSFLKRHPVEDFVIVKYDDKYYPDVIEKMPSGNE